jgi:uncharacterized repeat protein (TIGR01451 family)
MDRDQYEDDTLYPEWFQREVEERGPQEEEQEAHDSLGSSEPANDEPETSTLLELSEELAQEPELAPNQVGGEVEDDEASSARVGVDADCPDSEGTTLELSDVIADALAASTCTEPADAREIEQPADESACVDPAVTFLLQDRADALVSAALDEERPDEADEADIACDDEDDLDDAVFERFETTEDDADAAEFDDTFITPAEPPYAGPDDGDVDESPGDMIVHGAEPDLAADVAELHPGDPCPSIELPESLPLEAASAATSESIRGDGESLLCSVASLSQEYGAADLEMRRIEPDVTGLDLPITYGFIVRNTAPVTLSNVRVEHVLPEGARCIGVLPRPQVFGNKLIWKVGNLEADAEHRFLVRIEKRADVTLPSDATAVLHASYYLKAPVTRPRLVLSVNGPDRVRVGEAVSVCIEVKNSGTSPAKDLKLRDQLTAGLEHADGQAIEANLGTLAPGEAIQLTLTTTASQAGQQANVVSVTSSEGLVVSMPSEVIVTEPVLSVRSTPPVRCLVDKQNEYRIEVANTGTAPIEQVSLIDALPEELEFVAASEGGEFDASDRSVFWLLGSLFPGQTRSFKVEFVAKAPGTAVHRALAWSDCGLESIAEVPIVCEIDENRSSHLLEDLLAAIEREDEAVAGPEPLEPPHAVPARSARGVGRQHVVFTIGEAEYAIPIGNVLEYGHPLSVTPVPNLPEWLLGVANVHGDIISMVDLRLFLGMERLGYDQDSRMLVVRASREDMSVGLIVDRVKGIRVLAEEGISLPTSPVEDRLAPYLRGVTTHRGRLLVLLDLDRLLLSPEMRQFEPV